MSCSGSGEATFPGTAFAAPVVGSGLAPGWLHSWLCGRDWCLLCPQHARALPPPSPPPRPWALLQPLSTPLCSAHLRRLVWAVNKPARSPSGSVPIALSSESGLESCLRDPWHCDPAACPGLPQRPQGSKASPTVGSAGKAGHTHRERSISGCLASWPPASETCRPLSWSPASSPALPVA